LRVPSVPDFVCEACPPDEFLLDDPDALVELPEADDPHAARRTAIATVDTPIQILLVISTPR
jgi:hypothetical protein